MSAEASIRHCGSVAIVDLSGRITTGDGCGLVRGKIKELVTGGHKDILLNLQNVGYIDSAGLGELAGSWATISKLGGQVKLLTVDGKVKNMLEVARLYAVFVSFSD